MIELTRGVIDFAACAERVRQAACGAVVLFLGTVRELTDGKRTIALDYEGHESMAQKKLAEIEAEARSRWQVCEIVIVHRLGRLELGDVSVAVAVSCPHRAEAFDACRFTMDRIKQLVPIWKRENWADGTTDWVHPASGEAVKS